MSVEAEIERKIREAIKPEHLDIINESHMHNVPPGSESHFKVIIVSSVFDNLGRVQRHQTINRILAAELSGPVHALSMETMTTGEWNDRGGRQFESPLCRGGNKADSG